MAPRCSREELEAACGKGTSTTKSVQHRTHITEIMRQHGVSPTKLNDLLDAAKLQAEEMEIWKEIETSALKAEWKESQKVAASAPDRERAAEKAYIVFTQGEQAYRKMLEDKYGKEAAAWSKDAVERKSSFVSDLFDLLQDYASMYVALPRLQELALLREREEEALSLAIKERKGDAWTDDRRVVYEVKAHESLGTVRTVLMVMLYIVLVVYLVKGDMVSSKRYKKVLFWIGVVVYALAPWLVASVSRFLFGAWAWLRHKWSNRDGRNVALSY
tara:strand:- start:3567 stop:4385 length:819 start_codon:yes stop_codon:yes gene_type:complete